MSLSPLVYQKTTSGLGRHVLLTFPQGIKVPSKFSGIQNATYPINYSGLSSPRLPRTMSAHERSHDLNGSYAMWRNLNTANGVFNPVAVGKLDLWLDQCYADGLEVNFCVYGTPAWAANTSVNWTDQYGYQYNANPTSDLSSAGSASLSSYITWLVNRYNSGAVKKIKYIEAWNEPLFSATTSSFFTGTPVQLAQMMKAVYTAAKAADPSIIVLSPGFAGMSSGLSPMVKDLLTAAVGDGTTGKDWCDAIAFHPYDLGVHQFHSVYPVASALQNFLLDVSTYAPGKLIFNTEQGFLHGWDGISQVERASIIKKSALLQAALGIQKITWYGASSGYASGQNVSPTYVADNLIGGPLTDETIREAFTWVQELSGITIYEVGIQSTGVMYATTDRGFLTTV